MLGKRTKREEQGLNLSFLDVVCCGFGAVILLLVITKIHEPVIIERSREELEGLILMLERELFEIRGESSVLKRDLEPLRAEASERVRRVDVTRREVEEAEDRHFAARETAAAGSDEAGNLLAARQSLTEEMERLLAEYRPAPNETTVGGIPVDSEYIIFVIDTSGSMVGSAWQAVQRVVAETLRVYPTVKGVQILNDEGQYLFSSFAGKWIPDSAVRRQSIIRAIANWQAYSDSDPAEGIVEAITTFYDESKKVSIYVFGDDFSKGSAESLVRYVERINEADRFGNCLVRIHAVGFPVLLRGGWFEQASRFANLMRVPLRAQLRHLRRPSPPSTSHATPSTLGTRAWERGLGARASCPRRGRNALVPRRDALLSALQAGGRVVVDGNAVHQAMAVAEIEHTLVDGAAVVPEGHGILTPGKPALKLGLGAVAEQEIQQHTAFFRLHPLDM